MNPGQLLRRVGSEAPRALASIEKAAAGSGGICLEGSESNAFRPWGWGKESRTVAVHQVLFISLGMPDRRSTILIAPGGNGANATRTIPAAAVDNCQSEARTVGPLSGQTRHLGRTDVPSNPPYSP